MAVHHAPGFLKLVEDAMKLQVANPTFADARDAILQANQVRFP